MTKAYFSYKQLKCIELLATGTVTQVKIAEELKINPASITRWKKDPKFMHAVVMRSRAILKEDLPEVYKSLASNSKTGSHQHIKILLDHLEALEEAKTKSTSSITFVWKDEGPDESTD